MSFGLETFNSSGVKTFSSLGVLQRVIYTGTYSIPAAYGSVSNIYLPGITQGTCAAFTYSSSSFLLADGISSAISDNNLAITNYSYEDASGTFYIIKVF